ncbi:MAG: histidine kinase [Rikenellaceae bacterium]|nr:histidine kinase [Rikenellaceae bacterium]
MKNHKYPIHTLTWIAVIAINYFVLKSSGYTGYGFRLFVTTLLWLVFFYVNYSLLIPKLLLRKKVVIYVLSSIIFFTGTYFLSKYTDIQLIKRELKKQYVSLESFDDVKESWEIKTEEYRRSRDRERKEHTGSSRIPGVGSGRRQLGSGNRMEHVPPPYDEERERTGFTDREAEYDRALRDYERSYRRYNWFVKTNYNPLEGYNLSYFFILIFFYLAGLALSFMDKYSKETKRRTELENEKVAAELAYLKQQINPHFLFNTLNAIYSYTISVSDEASDAVLKLSAILRYMLYETDKKKVPLSDEISILYDYIELQKLRITDKTDMRFEITGDPSEHLIEPMLLIPIIENAFKYGVDSLKDSFIHIRLAIEKKRIEFEVTNRIIKRNNEPEGNSGIGIKNIKRRLKLIYGNNYSLVTEEKNGIFNVALQLNTENRLTDEMYSSR